MKSVPKSGYTGTAMTDHLVTIAVLGNICMLPQMRATY